MVSLPVATSKTKPRIAAQPGFTADMRKAAAEVVERLVVATRLRYPVVGDLARSIRYEAYERPLIDAARGDVFADVREQLKQLAAGPGPEEYAERLPALRDSEVKATDAELKRNIQQSSVDILLTLKEKGKQSISLNGGVSGLAGEMKGGLVWNSIVTFEPSSR